ncbi:DUF1206 domain-containing protein [Sphingobium boeckii]|uniref:DUF1206 domain-containing protein n=1 Tax=Sphingobium boeckii TaxID=1082345 RepID=A0A7W9AKA7_9SPHN|nr:DUF1206 domain-containing protein [Sphingobium boeckii]MBB5687220.1 hypothetical protein [Sphingobium boeckii]
MLSNEAATVLARLGFAARGLVYLIIGWFAVDAAMRGGAAADNQGAIATLAHQPFGQILLFIVAAGLAGYAVWRLTEAAANPEQIAHDAHGNLKRIGSAVSGIAHVTLAWTAVKLASHSGSASGARSPGDDNARDWTAWLLSQPFGRLLVAAVAIGLFAAAFQQGKKAWTASFTAELKGDTPVPAYVTLMGRIGYGARAIVFTIIGGFFTAAAWQARASEAGGMADALAKLQGQPGGKWLLMAMGIGLALFGIFSLIESRFRRIDVRLPR